MNNQEIWRISTPDSPAWNDDLAQFDFDFYYLPDYASACARLDRSEAFAFYYQNENGSVFIPLLAQPLPRELRSKKFDAATPYGYSGPLLRASDPAATAGLLEQAMSVLIRILDERNCLTLFIRAHPLCGPPASVFPPTLTIVTHGDVVVIDLKQSERDRWLQLRNNHRRDIVKLIQRDFEITIDDSADALATFAKLYEQTMRRVSAADHYYFPPSYYHDLLRVRGCRVVIANVRTGGRVSCSGIFVLCANVVSYHLGGTDDEFLSHAPSKLMFWRMANWAAEQHAEYMNLGGGLGGRQDSLFAFKSGFSRFRLPFFTARAVVSRDEYDSLCQRKLGAGIVSGAGGDITGFFPPYRRQDPGVGLSEIGRRVAER